MRSWEERARPESAWNVTRMAVWLGHQWIVHSKRLGGAWIFAVDRHDSHRSSTQFREMNPSGP